MSNKATQFKPGQSGNPNGAPKRSWTWSGELQKAVERQNADGTPVKEGIANALIDQALQGNVVATKELMNRMDGMPEQDMNLKGKLETIIIAREPRKTD